MANSIPSSTKPTPEQIREWNAELRSGGAIQSPDGTTSYILAIVRRLNGLGVDGTDPNGIDARAYVNEVLGAR